MYATGWQGHRALHYGPGTGGLAACHNQFGRVLEEEGQVLMPEEVARVREGRALCILDGSVLEKPRVRSWRGCRPCAAGA